MPSEALVECRADYAVGTFIFMLRWFVQWKRAGFRSWSWGEAMSICAWFFFTVLYAELEVIAVIGAPILLTDKQREALPVAAQDSFREGAKWMFSCFFVLIFMIWSLKGCLVFLFLGLTRDTWLYRYVQIVGTVTSVAFLIAVIAQTTHCLPIERNWQILPDPGRECSTGYTTNIVIATGNVLTDILLLLVSIFILRGVRMEAWRKIRIAFLLSLGLFVIAIAIVRCVLSIGNSAQVALASVWAQREALVAIFAVNAPIINGMFRLRFWNKCSSEASEDQRQIVLAHQRGLDLDRKARNPLMCRMGGSDTLDGESISQLV